MQHKIALQLYSVREYMAKDFEGTVRKVADMGYAGVETAGVPEGVTYAQAASLFKELGLEVCSAHMPLVTPENEKEVVEDARTLGIDTVVTGKKPDDFKDAEAVRKTCEEFNQAAEILAGNGLKMAIHNHWWEFLKAGDDYAYQLMMRDLAPQVGLEIDTYWVKTAGCDPVAVIRELGGRVVLLHMKDGPCDKDKCMTPLGRGIMDFPAIVAAADNIRWLIVEQDRGETDMLEAAAESQRFLQGVVEKA